MTITDIASDPLALAQDLIRCASVTPKDAGAMDVLTDKLDALGFTCHRLMFEEEGTAPVHNLYARFGTQGPNLCFAGHTDVVPEGTGWSTDPYAATVRDGQLIGRGAADMKGAIAAFIAAFARSPRPHHSVSLLITGDEEGPAINGTRKVLDWLDARGERLDHCIVGEPTNPLAMGDMVKIGRRGSLNVVLTVHGTQGHVAYPHQADNPVPKLLAILTRMVSAKLDDGTDHFQPSNLEVTDLQVGNTAHNVIPNDAHARLNIRFNDLHRGADLITWLDDHCRAVTPDFTLKPRISGEAFLTPPGPFTDLVAQAVTVGTGATPDLSTSGGTSDARFIRRLCPVVEFGLVGRTMHKVDEQVAVADIETLTNVYSYILKHYGDQVGHNRPAPN